MTTVADLVEKVDEIRVHGKAVRTLGDNLLVVAGEAENLRDDLETLSQDLAGLLDEIDEVEDGDSIASQLIEMRKLVGLIEAKSKKAEQLRSDMDSLDTVAKGIADELE